MKEDEFGLLETEGVGLCLLEERLCVCILWWSSVQVELKVIIALEASIELTFSATFCGT